MKFNIKNLYLLKRLNVFKFISFVFFGLIFISPSFAQTNYEKAVEYFNETAKEFKLNNEDLSELIVTDQYVSKKSGVEHIYIKQGFKGIEVNNSNSSIHFTKENTVLIAHNKFIGNYKSNINRSEPVLSALEAIKAAAEQLGLENSKYLEIVKKEQGLNSKGVYSGGEISTKDIPFKLVYQPQKDGSIVLAWELWIDEIKENNSWVILIDAETGKMRDKLSTIVFCSFGCEANKSNNHAPNRENHIKGKAEESNNSSVSITDSYRVYELPLEDPGDDNPDRTLVQEPQDPIASPEGWRSHATATLGNNVQTSPFVYGTGEQNNIFDFDLDLQEDPENYEDAASTNAFYVGNMAHDILYHHGFDEASGNYQLNNFGKGGEQNDNVYIWIQISENCNAIFDTNPDGTSSTIKLYINSNRDGAFSNRTILHEYAHGLSSRLVDGPDNIHSLSFYDENLREGWSDFIALLLTIKSGDTGETPQSYGGWFYDAPNGVRPYSRTDPNDCTSVSVDNAPYSTDLNLNPFTYDDIDSFFYFGDDTSPSIHGIGSVWASMLWDMAWGLIGEYGFNPNMYEDTGGNNMALDLVILGMKLSPNKPAFVDARDAILAADQALYCGANACIIWEAFAKRGLGIGADQGEYWDTTDGTASFDLPEDCYCCSEFSDWPNTICLDSASGITLPIVLIPGRGYEYNPSNWVCLVPGFEADATNNLAFLAHISYCVPQPNLRESETEIQDVFQSNVIIQPNPFSDECTITFDLVGNEVVAVSISDITGKSIATLLNNEQRVAGKHQVQFDGSHLPTGIYYCSIQAGDQIETQKMVIVK